MNNIPNTDPSGYEIITSAIVALIKSYSELAGEDITFSDLSADGGITVYANPSAIVEQEHISILGEVRQQCAYSFTLIYRVGESSEARKIAAKELLDSLGVWLERSATYPELTDNRKITDIQRVTSAYLVEDENGVEQWETTLKCRYTNQFKRREQ